MKTNKKEKIYNDNVCMCFEASALFDIIHFTMWGKSLGSKFNLRLIPF